MNIPKKLQDNCQFIGYQCESYEMFKAGKCADCGQFGSKCSIFDVWGLVNHRSATEFRKQIDRAQNVTKNNRRLYFDTSGTAPYCREIKYHVNLNR